MKNIWTKIKAIHFTLLELFMFASIDFLLTLIGVKLGFLQELNPIVNLYINIPLARLGIQMLVIYLLYRWLKLKFITQIVVDLVTWAEVLMCIFLSVQYVIMGIMYAVYYFG